MANGFLTEAPASRPGDSTSQYSADFGIVQKFTCPGSGTILISRIGVWLQKNVDNINCKVAIFEHDSSNSCPSGMVANSESGEMTVNNTGVLDYYATYTTKPELTGGNQYWIGCIVDGSVGLGLYIDRIATTGKVAGYGACTYPNWPTDTGWHTMTAVTNRDYSLYAVYEEAASGLSIPVVQSIYRRRRI